VSLSLVQIGAVALGGAVGAVARYAAVTALGQWLGPAFPWGTVAVNVAGSLAMGLLVGAADRVWQPGPELRLFLTVGVLGGFTTFSSFSLDAALLIERGDIAGAVAYVTASVILSIAALVAGLALFRVALP
jgi:CrcB protein